MPYNPPMSSTVDLACELIARPSVTPDDAGCQELMIARLEAIGFAVERLPFGEVSNFWAQRGDGEPLFAFAGHTDVVPSGPLDAWESDPFSPVIRDGRLYGRGAADMKGSLAAMVTACERFIAAHPDHRGAIAFLITSDEEGPSVDGTRRVIEVLESRGMRMDCCLVGEPTAERQVGDVIKNGRRGSLGATLTVRGIQGHIAYPHLADNPIHRLAPALAELCALRFDQGNEFFPPTSFQVSNINGGTGADNVIPGSVRVMFNFRYSTETDATRLRETVEAVLRAHPLDFEIEWRHSGEPFLTPPGLLVDAVRAAVREVTGCDAALSTSGGTSDGRFIAKTGAQVVELGPVNATIHKVNECVDVAELDALSAIYESVLRRLLAG